MIAAWSAVLSTSVSTDIRTRSGPYGLRIRSAWAGRARRTGCARSSTLGRSALPSACGTQSDIW